MAAPPSGPTPDPRLVSWITRASSATGADPNALLATALQESGGQLNGPPGDQGTSFGPFQFHRGGALGAHSPAWASTYAATLDRAQQFKRYGVHGGAGAAAVQRPADRLGYAKNVDARLTAAQRIIERNTQRALADAATKPHAPKPDAPATPSSTPDIPGSSLLSSLMESPVQSVLDSNAKIAGVTAPTLPIEPTDATTATRATPTPLPTVRTRAKTVKPVSPGKVIPGAARIIGTPHTGTHTLGNWESDNAVDIAMPVGTAIRAPADGIIGSQIGSLGSSSPRFAGLRVHLKMAGDELYLAHLSRLAVKAGQRVKAGQIIGYSGEANGVAHLHLGSRAGHPGRYA